jgi:hypothetical protein
MPLSIWEYLRQRARDAVLAGFQDALDVAEQGDTEGSQHDAARRLVARLAAPRAGDEVRQLPPVAPLPHASRNGEAAANGRPEAAPVARAAPPEAARRPADASAFDAELESRFNSAGSQSGPETPTEPRTATTPTGRRRRGRPPKKSEGSR